MATTRTMVTAITGKEDAYKENGRWFRRAKGRNDKDNRQFRRTKGSHGKDNGIEDSVDAIREKDSWKARSVVATRLMMARRDRESIREKYGR